MCDGTCSDCMLDSNNQCVNLVISDRCVDNTSNCEELNNVDEVEVGSYSLSVRCVALLI